MNISIVSAKYVAPLKVELHFNDGTIKTIDVGALSESIHIRNITLT